MMGPSNHFGGAFRFRSLPISAPVNSSVNGAAGRCVIRLRQRKDHVCELLTQRRLGTH